MLLLSEYISQNRPVVIAGAAADWTACNLWNEDYLRSKMGEEEVTIDSTPNGRADSITIDSVTGEKVFAKPLEERRKLSTFLDWLEESNAGRAQHVEYLQHQNSSLTTEFKSLMSDTAQLPFAREAFGTEPDAINFWMGNQQSVSTFHKDPYENIYCVVKGEKIFTICPPTDVLWMNYEKVEIARWHRDGEAWRLHREGEFLKWIPVDPWESEDYPTFQEHASPLRIHVRAGDVLYLPSLWFHHVEQAGTTIAVNFWYDMRYGFNYAFYQLIEKLAGAD